ncbi:hypothetical protein CcaverHIS002_0207050 [Cutaneotrichosporon cavernicola]|uniref:Phenylalanine ammonia-lyase n=1 Tax=Cutaneotrichosporon cavernicola TaxID=279322 RepID=A0AA48IAQ9_9TREE|nr:uncharacterized protein CcaverHIS019_0207040 [Cutaneotrichosporon cavernicola]BEI81545.1 hypothetical protein CcaverHIS002_0207050 [Cutaneotrichosporon cavernicola]BEI89342.1 hypothetical protein CcaverHIS019_0207040 [Cutaneotrichosporon cavernicola]BEI97117.1 hypothetical protein CcaverHIS631_0207060 [Cutaneotrichosporon cavernicola]BEJ04890.1 hypothetical protein CcaverHIS641_0207070 [Cutaneotrichosporon cavernicola]
MFIDANVDTIASTKAMNAGSAKASSVEPFQTYAHSQATKTVIIDGHNMKIGDVVAVARNGAKVELSPSVIRPVQASVDFKESKKHTSIYGVTTGFGGSADTRTSDTEALQISLLEHQLCGFLPTDATYEAMLLAAMPIPIVRGAMAVRVNSCVRGHSGVRLEVLQSFAHFINLGLVPCVPLRGTISASGDLSPLSYIAGAICGHPDIKVFDTAASPPAVLAAPEAIAKYQLKTVKLASKEGLGLVNGTAVSAAAGALALYDAECLAMMSQTNTALTVEALDGHVGSFAPFIQEIRPHVGQIEAAKNIRHMLGGSKLAVHEEPELLADQDAGILRQDRYALRTSAQWIGPQLEALGLARQQIETELNSTTDNPLIDVEGGMFHHGGNFQAMAVTSAMDSTRIVLQNLGKLSFAQVTELINCEMNHGLPANLAGSEPSTNYHCKGLDIHCGAYCAELGFLANPMSNHIQSTEMHNQSVNSMAFVSARKTMEANEVLSLLLGSQMYCATQALDLRVMEVKFKMAIVKLLNDTITKHFAAFLTPEQLVKLNTTAAITLYKRLNQTPSWDSGARFEDAAKHLVGCIMDALMVNDDITDLTNLPKWKKEFSNDARDLYRSILDATTADGRNDLEPAEYLGQTRAVYEAVRSDLGVKVRRGDVAEGKSGKSIGSNVALIVEGMRDGRLMNAVGKMF